jgi:uncharacterized protein (DUF1697 family)
LVPRYVAFLRGINVGGRKATSDQLRAGLEKIGCEDVTTFRASGNVVFTAPGSVASLAARIERGLEQSLGYEVATFVRTAKEIKAIAAYDPFDPGVVQAAKGKVHVVLLGAKPTAQARKRVLALETADDLLALRGRELYWLPSGGLMESAVGMNGITKAVGPNTMRTKGTVEQLAAKFFSD